MSTSELSKSMNKDEINKDQLKVWHGWFHGFSSILWIGFLSVQITFTPSTRRQTAEGLK